MVNLHQYEIPTLAGNPRLASGPSVRKQAKGRAFSAVSIPLLRDQALIISKSFAEWRTNSIDHHTFPPGNGALRRRGREAFWRQVL
jgi:hypothetical protein